MKMYKTMKIYYRNDTGEVVWATSYNYPVTVDFDKDYNAVNELNQFDKTFLSMLVLTDGQYAQDFADGRLIRIDIDTKVPIFEYHIDIPDEPIVPSKPLSVEIKELKQKTKLQDATIEELMFVIIPELTGGGI